MTRGKKATKAGRSSKKWCPECGFHMRGDNHKNGLHCKTASTRPMNEKTGIGIPGRTADKTRRRHGMN